MDAAGKEARERMKAEWRGNSASSASPRTNDLGEGRQGLAGLMRSVDAAYAAAMAAIHAKVRAP